MVRTNLGGIQKMINTRETLFRTGKTRWSPLPNQDYPAAAAVCPACLWNQSFPNSKKFYSHLTTASLSPVRRGILGKAPVTRAVRGSCRKCFHMVIWISLTDSFVNIAIIFTGVWSFDNQYFHWTHLDEEDMVHNGTPKHSNAAQHHEFCRHCLKI